MCTRAHVFRQGLRLALAAYLDRAGLGRGVLVQGAACAGPD
jgi:hypothetical protein